MKHPALGVLCAVLAPLPCLAQSVSAVAAPTRAEEIRELRQELQRISARLTALEASSPHRTRSGRRQCR